MKARNYFVVVIVETRSQAEAYGLIVAYHKVDERFCRMITFGF